MCIYNGGHTFICIDANSFHCLKKSENLVKQGLVFLWDNTQVELGSGSHFGHSVSSLPQPLPLPVAHLTCVFSPPSPCGHWNLQPMIKAWRDKKEQFHKGWTKHQKQSKQNLNSEKPRVGFWLPGAGGWGELEEAGERAYISSYKMNKEWRANVCHGNCGWYYCIVLEICRVTRIQVFSPQKREKGKYVRWWVY